MSKKKNKIVNSTGDKVLYTITNITLILVLIIVLYPIIFVLSSSLSSGSAIGRGKVWLYPVEFTLNGYEIVFAYRSVWVGMKNSIFYTVVGTMINMILSILVAYPLSRRQFHMKGLVTTLFTITMVFSAGLVPTYLAMSTLGMVGNRLGYLLLSAISTYNMIIIRTYFQNSIPEELIEAAQIDGYGHFGTLFRIVLPLSKSVLCVVALYYAVAHWNAYFNAMIYLRDKELQPLQCVLRTILNAANVDTSEITDVEALEKLTNAVDQIRYALIVVTSVPIIAIYPLVQKYFKKGVMIGSVKG